MRMKLQILAMLAGVVGAAPAPPPVPGALHTSFAVGIWTVHTASLDFNEKTGNFSAPSKVLMTRVGGDVEADRASGNYKTQVVTLYGNVTMHDTSGNFAGLASASISHPNGPSTLSADTVHIDGKSRVYDAVGHVHYVQGPTTVDADRGMLNDASHMLYLSGNARVAQGDRNVVAEHIAYNTITGVAHAQGNVTMQFPSTVQPHIATPKPIRIPGLPTPAP